MNDFIKKQQELAREKLIQGMPDGFANLSETEVNDLIAQIITNTGEELLRWLEAKVVMALNEGDLSRKEGLERAIEHITNVTGAK